MTLAILGMPNYFTLNRTIAKMDIGSVPNLIIIKTANSWCG